MPIYYYIDLDCVPRRTIGPDQLIRKVQDSVLAERIAEQYRGMQPDISEDQMHFRRIRQSASGDESEEQWTVADLRKSAADLAIVEPHCMACPAALGSASFGCIQAISFPISAAGEEWLLGRIGTAQTNSGKLFRASVVQFGYGDCGMLDEWRASRFIESPAAIGRDEVGDMATVSSDQVLHAMFMSGDLAPIQTLSLLLFTQAISLTDGGDTDAVIELIQAIQAGETPETPPEFVFMLAPNADDPPTVFEMKTFLYAAFRAFSLNLPLAIKIQS